MTLALLMALALGIQANGSASTEAPAVTSPTAPAPYRVGAGDVLAVTVVGHQDLSVSPTVQPDGTIFLPLVRNVPVAGLTLAEIQRKLTNLLEKDYLVDPSVNVEIKEYQSQYVVVLGEVNEPGRKALRGETRLVDALVEAKGFKPNSSTELTITRMEGTFATGERTLRIRLSGSEMTPQDQVNLSIPLRHGDVITVLGLSRVTVQGEVNRPGLFPTDGQLTVTGAIALAGGRTRFGSGNVQVRRPGADGESGEIFDVDLGDVSKGEAEDLRLEPGDVVTVPRRRF
jgi:polysaccharide export outer membrane protein